MKSYAAFVSPHKLSRSHKVRVGKRRTDVVYIRIVGASGHDPGSLMGSKRANPRKGEIFLNTFTFDGPDT